MKATGMGGVCIHIMQIEKTFKLYREIFGLKLVNAEVFKSEACAEMLCLHFELEDGFSVKLSLTSPQKWHEINKIGNTNHNHFTLVVDNIVEVVEALIDEGYVMEHPEYKDIKYNFFTGPNGEIIGLSQK